MTGENESNDPMADVSGAVRVPHEVLKANSYLRSYVERMQEEADGYRHGDRRWTVINSFDPRMWPPSRPQPDETILKEDDLGLIAMARARYEDLSEHEKMLDLSHLWASEGDLRPAGVALAAAGRGADDRLVHVATGEMVVPRALLANDPWLRSFIVRVFKAAGLDWRRHVVGGPNRINPATGLPEFDPFDTHDDFGGRIEPDDVDERNGFDIDHRDPTGGGSSGGLRGVGGINVDRNDGGGSDSALGGGVGLVASGPGPAGSNEVSAYQPGLPEPIAGIGELDDHFRGLGGSNEITSENSVDMAGTGSVDGRGGLRRSGASPADRGISLGSSYVGSDPIEVNLSSGYRAPETAFSESSYSKLFDSRDPYVRQLAASDLQKSWTKMMDQALAMPQAEYIAANGLRIVPDDPDWELYGFEYDPVPNVEVARKVREQLNAHLEHNRLIKNSVPNFSPNTSINLADFDPVPDRKYLNRRAAAAKSRMMDVLSIAKIEPPTRIEEGSMRMEKGQVPTSDDHVDKLRDSPNVEFSEALKRSYDGPVGFFGVRIRNSPYRPFIFDMINDFIQAEKDLHEFKERQQSRN